VAPLLIKTTGLDEYLDPTGEAYIKMLLMGEPGSGKTPSAACWPKPIFADCENGLASIARQKVPYASIQTSHDMEAFLDHLRRDSLMPAERRKYKTVVIDTIDSYQRKLIEQRKREERKDSISGWADWGWLDGKMVQLIEGLINLRMNVIVNMHVKDFEESEGEGDSKNTTLVKKAKLKGDIKDSIWQDFDLIGLMEKTYVAENGERVQKRHIRWHSEPKYPNLRDRFNVLPRFTDVDFTERDYLQIFEAIANSLDEIPESGVAEEIETQEDPEPAPADAKGGPVDSPKLPPKKTTKKAAAKKAAPAKKPEPEPEPEKAPEPATPVAEEPAGPARAEEAPTTDVPTEEPAAQPEPTEDPETLLTEQLGAEKIEEQVNGRGTAEEPVTLPEGLAMAQESKALEALDHVHMPDGTCRKNTFGGKCGTDEGKVTATAPASDEGMAAPERKAGAKHCGDQPATMAGKYAPAPGCGAELSAANGSRAQIAMLRLKTFLCDDCHAAASA
jgi:hypothetical protein